MRAGLVAALLLAAACGSGGGAGSHGTVHLRAAAQTFDTLDDMVAASDLVIVGTVTEVGEGRFTPAPVTEDFAGTQSLRVQIHVDDVLVGDPPPSGTVAIPWPGWEVAADGTPGPQGIYNDQPVPTPGDRDVWFLAADPGGDTLGLVAYEGRMRVAENGRPQLRAPVGSGAAREVQGFATVAELAAALRR